MKLTLFLTVTLFTGVLATPLSKTVIVREKTLAARRLPVFATPRIGVTVASVKKGRTSHVKRSISRKDVSLVGLVDRVAEKIKERCDDIESVLEETKVERLSKDKAVHKVVRKMNSIRATLSRTVSIMDRTPTLDLTQDDSQAFLNHAYFITKELHNTVKDSVATLGGTGARSMSRATHMLADVLSNIVTINPSIASDVYRKLSPIYSDVVSTDEKDLHVFIMSSVTEFLSSIKPDDLDSCSSGDCFNSPNEELK
ncbi:uncharacterized protein FPRO_05286 [Fusarium proliferatum ET1]|uniref:Uncharacterized protein n=2 Tax=Gibberella intermedia TaxID=948311 RepID=A0A1L7VKK9_FUSPR|nr:uncharacterized protein FPRO_05286 [Fusarium proliferatum ET1]RBA15003.1 hypothetical protein FPRO05_13219 [Fusarium proliferatum]CZR40386.1 uncharacterized protein FPRO_05286 [Fusarium proliferatum ET1]